MSNITLSLGDRPTDLMYRYSCGCLRFSLGQGKAYLPCAQHQARVDELMGREPPSHHLEDIINAYDWTAIPQSREQARSLPRDICNELAACMCEIAGRINARKRNRGGL